MSVVSGPTQGAERHAEKVDRWKSRPRLARFLRALMLISPIAISIAFTWAAGKLFPPESLGIGKWTWVLLIFVLANVVLAALRVVTKRLLPLVALMKLTLVFPDHAPSRAKATLRKSSSRTLLREMEEARLRGETTGAALHGDYLVQLLKEVNEHDRLTRGHSERVRAYSELLGEELGLSDDDMHMLRWAALLHDVGKLSVPSEILNKDGRPTDEEWKVLSNHPAVGGSMLEPLRPWLGDWIHAADQHHCRWDGKGYPENLAGTDIAFSGRLVAIADSYDVMTSARSYKKPLGPELARQELTECAGAQFDPTMVRAFLQIGLNRLKTVAGPLAWFANLAGSTQVPVPAAGVVTSGAVGAGLSSVGLAVASIGGFVPFVEDSAPVLAFEEPAIVVEVEQEQLEVHEVVASATEGTPVRIVLTARGGDGELTFSVGSAANGEVTLVDDLSPTDTEFVPDAGDGWENTVSYSPDEDFFGVDTFSFEVCDDSGSCETQQVRITVASSNSAPTAREDQASVDAGETIVVDVLANDTDPDVDPIELRDAGPAGHGQATVVGSSLQYTADEDYDGVDEFVYTIVDPEGASATGRVTITVSLPVAPTTTTLAPATTTTLAPATTTTLAPATTTTLAPTTTTTNPPPVNAPPTVGDDATTIAEDLTVLIDVLANDADPETDPITIASVSAPGSGVATIEAGQIRYTPNPDYSGPDSFTYTASDGVNAGVVGTVNVVVTPVNDSPVITGSGLSVPESIVAGTTVFSVTATDVDPDTLTLSISAGDPGGLFAVDPTGVGTLVGTLDFETQALHTLDITVFDGTVSRTVQVGVTVSDVNEAPTAGDDVTATTEDIPVVVSLGGNDADTDGDTLTWNLPATTTAGAPLTHIDGDFTYTPPLNFNGADSFTYTVSDPDGLVSNTATVSIVVFADNDAPLAVDDSGLAFAVAEDASITTGNVTSNDTDVDNPIDATTTTVVAGPSNGTLTNNGDGTFDYTPDPNHNGTDTFTYTITDAGALTSNTATVTLTITPDNDPPIANNDNGAAYTLLEDSGTLTTPNVTANDTDVDNPIDATTTTVVAGPSNGTLTNNGDGTFDYTPDLNHNGTDTFTYTITDPGALTSNTATVTLTITPDNDAPLVTNPGAQTGLSGEAFSLSIVATDVELDGLSYGATGLPAGLSIDGAGLISGTLGGATSGTHNVDVTVTDDGVPVRSTTVNFDIDVADYAVSSLAGDLVITEVMYYAGLTFPTEEFVEIYNNGPIAIDVTGFVLADSDLKNDGPQNTNYTIPATDHWGTSSLLQPGEHVVIWPSYDGITLPPLNNPPTGLEYVVNNGGGSAFDNFGESVWLLETPSHIIDYMAYDSGGGDTLPPASLGLWDATDQGSLFVTVIGRSLSLTPHGVDGNTASCWEETASGDAAATCPGAPITVDTEPGSQRHSAGKSNNDVLYGSKVVLSEFRTSGPGGNTDEFIEIFNADSLDVDLTGWELRVTGTLNFDFYAFPSVVIAPGQHFLVAHSGSPLTAIADDIWTGLNYGTWGDIVLKDADGIYLDIVGFDSGSNPTLFEGSELPSYPGGFLDRSYERLAGADLGNCVDTDDNSADWFFNTVASTPRTMSDPLTPCGVATNVVISEFSSTGGETGSNDFIELYNPTAASIDIEGWLLSIADDTAIVQSILLTGPNTVLPAGGHYLVDELGAADQTLVGIPAELAIRIADGGTPVDEVGTAERNNAPALWPGLWSEGTGVPPLVAIAGYEQSWERKLGLGVGNCVDTNDNASDFVRNLTAAHVNPQSSADPVELCGSLAAPTPPAHLVISEYRTDGPGGGTDEFVEIFNPTGGTISLSGYELRRAGDNSTEHTFSAFNLAPGQHYLVGGVVYAGSVDDTHNGFTNDAGGVRLYDTIAGSTVDEANTDESPPNLPEIDGAIDQTYKRRAAGCQDTDVMIDDFYLSGSPTPTTSSDPATPC